MNEMNEREQDAAAIMAMQQHVENSDPAEMQAICDDFIHAALREIDRVTAERDGAYTEYRSQLVAFRDEANERQRLLAEERDAAHEKIVSFGSTMADLIMLRSENTRLEAETIESAAILEKAVKESKAIVAGYNRAIEERDAARAENKRLRAACEDTADVIGWYLGDGDGLAALVDKYGSIREVRQVMKDKAAALRAALGLEGEASE